MRSALVLLAFALPACRHPNLGEDFGKAKRAAMERQIAAGSEPPGTLDGQDAKNVTNAHHAQTPAGQTSPQGQQGPAEGGPMVLMPAR